MIRRGRVDWFPRNRGSILLRAPIHSASRELAPLQAEKPAGRDPTNCRLEPKEGLVNNRCQKARPCGRFAMRETFRGEGIRRGAMKAASVRDLGQRDVDRLKIFDAPQTSSSYPIRFDHGNK